MSLRNICWIADTGILVGRTQIGTFDALPSALTPLALSVESFVLGYAASGSIDGNTAGSTIIAADLPIGFAIDAAAPGWSYNGGGAVGTYTLLLTETLAGITNSPLTTPIAITIAAASGVLDFSQSSNSGLAAALRRF